MKVKEALQRMLPYPSLGEAPPTMAAAQTMTDRYRFADNLHIKAFDSENKLFVLDEGDRLSLAAVFEFAPLLAAGMDTERQVGGVIKEMPAGSALQFGMIGWPDTDNHLDVWRHARSKAASNQIFIDMAEARVNHYRRTAKGLSLTREGELYPRSYRCYLSLYMPGPKTSEPEKFDSFLQDVVRRVDAYKGKMQAANMPAVSLDEKGVLRLYRLLLNPNLSSRELDERLLVPGATPRFPEDIMDKGTRMRVDESGDLIFSGEGETMHCRPMTVDMYPSEHYLFDQRKLIGDIIDGSSRIPAPFWAYTNITILDPQHARDQLMTKLGLMNKQTLSESAWFRSMLGSLIDRKNATETMLGLTTGEHALVRAYTGINIYGRPSEIENYAEGARSLWNKAGFQCSRERFISLPVFVASLPGSYTTAMDPPNRGLQRSEMMSTLNASTLAFCATDWDGNLAKEAGPLLVSRRGQVASVDLFSSDTNYNFAVAASSGSGKSFFANEICVDFLSKNGIARIIDVGRSYEKLASLIGGQVIEYDLDNPRSINPFWGIQTRDELAQALPMFKSMITLMAYPRHEPPAWEYQNIETLVAQTWEEKGADMSLEDIYFMMDASKDERARDIASQIKSYAVGRLARWFNGPREVGFDHDFTILELDGLNSDKELRNVVFAQTIHTITQDMYLANRKRPKLLLIDEAWDLMGASADQQASADFIETAARRIRKYNGALGTITQSYNDYYGSRASRAALENSAWRFTLRQKSESLEVAKEKNVFSASDKLTWKLLETVNSGSDYSEIHVSNDSVAEVFRFFVDPLSYWIYTTNPKDSARIDSVTEEQGCSRLEAIYLIANQAIRDLDDRADRIAGGEAA